MSLLVDQMGLSGNGLGLRSTDGSAATTRFQELALETIAVNEAAFKNAGIEVRSILSLNRSADSTSITPNDIITIYMSKGSFVSCISFYLSETTFTEFVPRTVKINDGNQIKEFTIPRFNSEVHDTRFVNWIKDRAKRLYPNSAEVSVLKSIVIYSFTKVDSVTVTRNVNKAINTLYNKIVIDMSGKSMDVNLNAINKTQNGALNLEVTLNSGTREDETGIPIADNVSTTLRVQSRTRKTEDLSLNVEDNSDLYIGKLSARAGVLFNGGISVGNNSNAYGIGETNKQPSFTNAFTPHITLEDIDLGDAPSMGKFLLMLANISAMANPAVIRNLYAPETIGVLNTYCNLEQAKVGLPYSPDECRKHFDAIFKKVMAPQPTISIIVRPGTWAYQYTSILLECAIEGNGVDGAKGINVLRKALAAFTGGQAGDINPANLVEPGYEEMMTGTFLGTDRSERPLSEIDLLWVMNYAPKSPELHKQWAHSSNTRDPDEGLCLKTEILDKVTKGNYELMDRRYLITLNPWLISALATAIRSTTIPRTSNLDQYSTMATTGWLTHMHNNNAQQRQQTGWL